MSRTTLAETLGEVFARLYGVPPGLTLWKAWSNVFIGLGTSDYSRVNGVAVVAQGIERLDHQIKESKKLKAHHRAAAGTTLASLKPTLDFGNLQVGFDGLRTNCRPEICGNLSFLGSALLSEFGEATLETADAESIKEMLVELVAALDSSSIDLDLRLALRQQIVGLIWWVSNREIVSVQQLFQSLGETVVLAGQVKERAVGGDTENKEKSRTIWDRAFSAFTIANRLVQRADGVVRAADQLSADSHHTIEAIRQAL